MQITPHLWFDTNAEDAVNFYTSIFKNSKIKTVTHYTDAGYEIHKMKAGTVMVIEFELDGNPYIALNGGPLFKFNESISFIVPCKDQEEIDYYWEKLGQGGDPAAQQCGWLKDKFGLSWQIVPEIMGDIMTGKDQKNSDNVMNAMMKMKKLDIAKLKAAYEGT